MRCEIEGAGSGEDEKLAPRMRDADRDREQQQTAKERDIESDDAEDDREHQTDVPPECPAIDRGDAVRVAVDQLAAALHRGDRAPKAERAQVGSSGTR